MTAKDNKSGDNNKYESQHFDKTNSVVKVVGISGVKHQTFRVLAVTCCQAEACILTQSRNSVSCQGDALHTPITALVARYSEQISRQNHGITTPK